MPRRIGPARLVLAVYTGIFLVYTLVPIAVMIAFSFNQRAERAGVR